MNEDVAAHEREESLIRSFQEKEEEEKLQKQREEEEERLRKQREKEEEEERARRAKEEEEERKRREREEEEERKRREKEEEEERKRREKEEEEERKRREKEEEEERRKAEEAERKQIAEEQAKRWEELSQRRERREKRQEEEKKAAKLRAERREAERQKHKEERERNMKLRETRRQERKEREAERKQAEEKLRQEREEERRRRSENRPDRPAREMLEEYRTKDRWVDFAESEEEVDLPTEKKAQPEFRQPSLPPAPPSESTTKNTRVVSVTDMLRTSYMPTRQTTVEEYQDQGDVAKSTVFAYPQYGDYRKKNRESIEGTLHSESGDRRPEAINEVDEEEDALNAKPEETDALNAKPEEEEDALNAKPEEAETGDKADGRPDEIALESSSDDLNTTLSTTMFNAIPNTAISSGDAPKPEGVMGMRGEDEEEKQNEADLPQEKVLSCSGGIRPSLCR